MSATIRDALVDATARLAAAGVPEPRADAEVLLAHAVGADRTALVMRAGDAIDRGATAAFEGVLRRREAREPVAYVLGTREFWSLDFAVDRRVLVPRPETEILVATALRLAPRARSVLDVGTGSGAIAVALARELAGATVVASDRSEPALAVAAANRARLAPKVGLVQGNVLAPFRAGAFDLVVANPPYCAEGTVVQAEVRDWEPSAALYAGPEGLDVLDALIASAPRVLRAGGWLVVEIGAGQRDAVVARVRRTSAFGRIDVADDYAGIARVVAAERVS